MSNLDQNYYESGQNVANGQIWFADGLFHEQKWGPHEIQNVGLNGWPRSNVDEGYVSRPPNYGPNVLGSNHGPNGGLDSGFGPVPDIGPNVVGSNASLLATNPVSNNVQLNPAKPFTRARFEVKKSPMTMEVFLGLNIPPTLVQYLLKLLEANPRHLILLSLHVLFVFFAQSRHLHVIQELDKGSDDDDE
ncbi:hypothetical protein GOBAR_DD27496 [Gossypium barbadense]|nr:hypothetical protein GOBAR_DD27496 [Gossypium barbadense]